MNSQTEIFVNITGYPNYQVSNFGNVKNVKSGRILKGKLRGDTLIVVLINDRERRYKAIHQIVAQAFIEDPVGCRFIDQATVVHIDRNRRNNHLTNLKYQTPIEYNPSGLNNTFSVVGISFDKCNPKWLARISAEVKIYI